MSDMTFGDWGVIIWNPKRNPRIGTARFRVGMIHSVRQDVPETIICFFEM